jgi:hypothetical protein
MAEGPPLSEWPWGPRSKRTLPTIGRVDQPEFCFGSGWPDPTEPGVPAEALHDGYHWLQRQDDDVPFIGQWAPDSWSWIVAWMPDRLCPKEMDHLHYIGPCPLPSKSR